MLQGRYVPKANDADRTLWTLTLETPRWRSEHLFGSSRYREDQPPWLVMPPNAVPFQKFNSIPLPAANGNDVAVLQFAVPQGYDGVISSLVQQYTGTGFVDGSGDLKWRIRIGDRWAEDMGNMITQLGSLQSPYQIYRSGIRLRDRDAVSYVVNHATGSSLTGGRIVCGCFGWYYPTA